MKVKITQIFLVSLLALVALVKLPSCGKITDDIKRSRLKKVAIALVREFTGVWIPYLVGLYFLIQVLYILPWIALISVTLISSSDGPTAALRILKILLGLDGDGCIILYKYYGLNMSMASLHLGLIDTVSLCEAHLYELNIWAWNYVLCVDGNCVYVDRNCPDIKRILSQ